MATTTRACTAIASSGVSLRVCFMSIFLQRNSFYVACICEWILTLVYLPVEGMSGVGYRLRQQLRLQHGYDCKLGCFASGALCVACRFFLRDVGVISPVFPIKTTRVHLHAQEVKYAQGGTPTGMATTTRKCAAIASSGASRHVRCVLRTAFLTRCQCDIAYMFESEWQWNMLGLRD